MRICMFDNPRTLKRELWVERQLVISIDVNLIETLDATNPYTGTLDKILIAAEDNFTEGNLVGDKSALPKGHLKGWTQ